MIKKKKNMIQKQNEEVDSMVEEFMNIFKDQYSSHFYYMRVTESKSRFAKNEKRMFESLYITILPYFA